MWGYWMIQNLRPSYSTVLHNFLCSCSKSKSIWSKYVRVNYSTYFEQVDSSDHFIYNPFTIYVSYKTAERQSGRGDGAHFVRPSVRVRVRPSRPVTSHSPSDEFRAFSVPFPFRLMNHTLWFSLGKKCKKRRTVNEICLVASRPIFGGFSNFLFTYKLPW